MFQFTIRDLLLVTVIVGLYAGWAGDRHEMGARIERLQKELASQQAVNYQTYQRGGRRDGLPLATDY